MNPRVIFEVLSETTAKDDRGWKRVGYQKIESLTDYLIISQDQAFAEHYRRDADGVRQHGCIEGLDRNIVIESINCVLPMAKVYRDIPFE
ncbi:MAG TPA: Uma2 family endonuclease [Blastocatellia bacterium]|nr:Uma2 family endonuclease [Blastocatellia bacterium]